MALAFYQRALDVETREIRLLELSRGLPTDTVSCNLKIASLDDANLVYEALSYVWGEIAGHVSIQVCGENFEATCNLEAALRHLRYRDRSRLLWVDAVCINQLDVQERNSQVKMMGSIYESAHQVVVWLGAKTKHTKDTMELIHRLASNHNAHWVTQSKALEVRDKLGGVGGELLSLYMFFRVPWWTRMWTLQEMAKARNLTFMCGSYTIPGEELKLLVQSFNKHFQKCCVDGPESGGYNLVNIQNRIVELERIEHLRENRTLVGFLKLAGVYRYRIATDPRDMIYGLLGMSLDLDSTVIDYQLPVTEAYEVATLALISKTGNLDVFSHILEYAERTPFDSPGGLPSWIPNWRSEYRFQVLRYSAQRQETFALFQASGDIQMDITRVSPGKVAISGLEFDTVEELAPAKEPSLLISYSTLDEWRLFAEVDSRPEAPYVGGKTIIDAFWRTLCCDMSAKGDNSRATFEDRVLHDEWWWLYLLLSHDERSAQEYARKLNHNVLDGINKLALSIYSFTAGRRLFRSKGGYMGIGPSKVQIGDQICVLFGGKTPFILRQKDASLDVPNQSQEWELVGDVYVHGIMDGETITMMEDKKLKSHTFILS